MQRVTKMCCMESEWRAGWQHGSPTLVQADWQQQVQAAVQRLDEQRFAEAVRAPFPAPGPGSGSHRFLPSDLLQRYAVLKPMAGRESYVGSSCEMHHQQNPGASTARGKISSNSSHRRICTSEGLRVARREAGEREQHSQCPWWHQ